MSNNNLNPTNVPTPTGVDSPANRQFRDSLMRDANNSQRLVQEYKQYAPIFLQGLEKVLDDYGFASALTEAKAAGKKLRLLNLACGEGLYLHDLAEVLEKRGLLAGAELYGIESDLAMINTAENYAKVSKPPRPYLNFFLHDIKVPFEKSEDLRLTSGSRSLATRPGFDFIFCYNTFNLTMGAQAVLTRIFRENLNSQGIIWLSEIQRTEEGIFSWPDPIFKPWTQAILTIVDYYNPGVEVAAEVKNWLQDEGAAEIQHYPWTLPIGGTSEQGLAAARNLVLSVLQLGPIQVANGLLTQAYLEQLTKYLYTSFTREQVGQFTGYTAIAKKS